MRILLVNTDTSIRTRFLDKLKQFKVSLDTVTSASEAIERMAHKSYDCLILDTELPDANGIDLARVFPRRHMILFSTDAYKPSIQQAAEDIGITTFFIKPAELPQLCSHLEHEIAEAG